MTTLLLRRTGRRPLRFQGRTLAREVWRLPEQGKIVLGLHPCEDGLFVCESALQPPAWCRAAFGILPVHLAASARGEDAAARYFETLSLPLDATDQASLALVAGLHAAFAHAAGEFLHTLASNPPVPVS